MPRRIAASEQRSEAPTAARCGFEDQDDAREMMRALLELRRHAVLEASDGRDAIELIQREKPDVAVVDIGLPVVNATRPAGERRRMSGVWSDADGAR